MPTTPDRRYPRKPLSPRVQRLAQGGSPTVAEPPKKDEPKKPAAKKAAKKSPRKKGDGDE